SPVRRRSRARAAPLRQSAPDAGQAPTLAFRSLLRTDRLPLLASRVPPFQKAPSTAETSPSMVDSLASIPASRSAWVVCGPIEAAGIRAARSSPTASTYPRTADPEVNVARSTFP